jgi:hypothetical protein
MEMRLCSLTRVLFVGAVALSLSAVPFAIADELSSSSISPETFPPRGSCAPVDLTQSIDPSTINFALSCGQTANNCSVENHWARVFDLSLAPTTGIPHFIRCVEYGLFDVLDTGGAGRDISIELFQDTNGAPANNANLVALAGGVITETVLPADSMTLRTVDFTSANILLPADASLAVNLHVAEFCVAFGPNNRIRAAMNESGETDPTYLKAAGCGLSDYLATGDIGFPTANLVMTIELEPGVGACCDGGVCTVTDEASCVGHYQGNGTDCSDPAVTCYPDICEKKHDISNGITAFDLTGATTGPPASPECPFLFGDLQLYTDIWFNYTATCTGTLRLDTCGPGDHDTRIQVYGTCDCSQIMEGTGIECNDDSGDGTPPGDPNPDYCNQGGAAPFESALDLQVVAGQCYKIRVGQYGQSGGHFGDSGPDQLNVECLCGNGSLDPGEQCDNGAANGTPGSCCAADCTFVAAATVCRPSAGNCDVEESCSGSSGACPTDGFAPGSQVCRPSAGNCDVAENCPGNGPNCPGDGFAPGSQVCRPSAGVCDVAENCPGNGPACPGDGFAPGSQVCRPSAGACDVAENCPGDGPACPGDGFAPGSQVCRPSAGICDVTENCTGTGAACPGDGFAPSSQECRASAGVCDVAENCSGSAADCPGDGFAPGSQVCRASAGECDLTENCTGSSAACPDDGFSSGNECEPSTGDCDFAEVCDGTSASCPPDGADQDQCVDDDDCCPDGCDGDSDNDCPPAGIPTVSEWGLVILTLLLLAAWKVYFGRRPAFQS